MTESRANGTGKDELVDVVIIGAGLAGLTAAYALRDRRILLLEERDRVGGRTFSSGDPDSWWNLGAQLLSSQRVIDLATSLGLDLVSIKSADFGYVVNGKLARGNSPERLLMDMKLPLHHKVDFGLASLRMRRKLHAVESMSPEQKARLDRVPLMNSIGRVSPITMRMLSDCCENAVGLPASGASALFGLVYGLGAFLDPRTKDLIYGVRGGTQRITVALSERLLPGTIRLSSSAQSVRQAEQYVEVDYLDDSSRPRTVRARECICAMPPEKVLTTVKDLPARKAAALARLTPYSPQISVNWAVADNTSTPWDGIFVCPVTGEESFSLITNYGFLAKHFDPSRGGYLNAMATTAKSHMFDDLDDQVLLDRQLSDLEKIFPGARLILDINRTKVQRWDRALPPMRPGGWHDRPAIRESLGRIHFCGDYTADPGLTGAHNSGRHAAKVVASRLEEVSTSAFDDQ